MVTGRAEPLAVTRAPSDWWRWLCFALIGVLCLGPGGVQRVHLAASHDHLHLAASITLHGGHDHDAEQHANSAGFGGDEVSASCDTCRDLEWARLTKTGTPTPAPVYVHTDFAIDRCIPFDDQVRSIRPAASIRSRAPPVA
jgi:hypothetical protein